MKTISALDHLSNFAIKELKYAITDYEDAADLLEHIYEDVKQQYETQKDSLDPDVRAMMCLILARIHWAHETTWHVRDILDRRVLYFMATRDDTQSHT